MDIPIHPYPFPDDCDYPIPHGHYQPTYFDPTCAFPHSHFLCGHPKPDLAASTSRRRLSSPTGGYDYTDTSA